MAMDCQAFELKKYSLVYRAGIITGIKKGGPFGTAFAQ